MKSTLPRNPPPVSHRRAKQLAGEWCEVRGPLNALAAMGAIVHGLADELENLLRFCQETGQPLDLVGEVHFLLDYVREHSERGPVAGWQNLK